MNLRAIIKLKRKAFEKLLGDFRKVYLSCPQKREEPRKRKIAAGRKAQLLTMEEKLFYVAADKKILLLTPSTKGKTCDKKIQDQEDAIDRLPDKIAVLVDSGFQGLQNPYPSSIGISLTKQALPILDRILRT
jgi:hypothetical protein